MSELMKKKKFRKNDRYRGSSDRYGVGAETMKKIKKKKDG